MQEAAREAAERIDAGRIELLPGDIASRYLGLSEEQYERLEAETTSVYHLAAIYNLAVPLELAQRINVDGTGNILELCDRCQKLERLHYMSTAYVAGTRSGVVYEHELSLGQGFKNHYESTKFQAEVWVKRWLDHLPITIYRPAIVVGDSVTGETQKFDGPYYMLRAVSLAQRSNSPILQFGRSEAPFNVVPVDFVVNAIVAAAGDPQTVGQTLHLVDPDPPTAREALAILAQAYAGRAPSMRIPPELVAVSLHLPAVRKLFGGAPHQSIRYLNHPVRFDARKATDLRERTGLKLASLSEYAPVMVRFFQEHESDPAYTPPAL